MFQAEIKKNSDKYISLFRGRLKNQQVELKQSLEDEIESIKETGQGSDDVDINTVQNVLKPNDVNKYLKRRDEAKREYDVIQSLNNLSEEDLQETVAELTPKPGQKDFEFENNLKNKAEKEIDRIRKIRQSDPAASVEKSSYVINAKENINADAPNALEGLAKARLVAQSQVGIPSPAQRIITKQEASQIFSEISQLNGKDLIQGLRAKVIELDGTYGKYAERAFKEAVESSIRDSDLAGQASGILKSMMANDALKPQEKSKLEEISDIQLRQGVPDVSVNSGESEAIDNFLFQKVDQIHQLYLDYF